MLSNEKISTFKSGFRGEVIEPSDRGYNEARALYNAMIDKKPRLIARCSDVADVIAAVTFGRENKMLIAIRGGGHNGPGLSSVNDGLVIDLSRLKGVRVDPATSTVRAEPGCTQGDVDHATHAFGLAVPAGIVSTTGLAGLTLGGGTGYLSRAHGLTIDNLIEADVVLADGRFVTASETQNADLFWALRGGGGNFGVVTSFAFRAVKISDVFGGPIFYDIKDAAKVMRVYRDTLAKLPEKLGTFLGLKTVPSTAPFPEEIWGRKICALAIRQVSGSPGWRGPGSVPAGRAGGGRGPAPDHERPRRPRRTGPAGPAPRCRASAGTSARPRSPSRCTGGRGSGDGPAPGRSRGSPSGPAVAANRSRSASPRPAGRRPRR